MEDEKIRTCGNLLNEEEVKHMFKELENE